MANHCWKLRCKCTFIIKHDPSGLLNCTRIDSYIHSFGLSSDVHKVPFLPRSCHIWQHREVPYLLPFVHWCQIQLPKWVQQHPWNNFKKKIKNSKEWRFFFFKFYCLMKLGTIVMLIRPWFFVGFFCRIRLGTFANFIIFNMMFWRLFLNAPEMKDGNGNFIKLRQQEPQGAPIWFMEKLCTNYFLSCKILQNKKFYILTL